MRITFSKTLLLATTAFSMISVPAANAYLSPLSFNEMYAHASRGNLTVLNNAILRGMNINAVNGDGDTGICVAIRRGDHIAYESFRNTGAHTRPRCLNNINAKQYKKFMADHRPYELAYRKEGSSIWWWIGGAAAVGGIALAAGGGSGPGGVFPRGGNRRGVVFARFKQIVGNQNADHCQQHVFADLSADVFQQPRLFFQNAGQLHDPRFLPAFAGNRIFAGINRYRYLCHFAPVPCSVC